MIALLLGTITGPIAQGQTTKRRVPTTRGRKTRIVRPAKAVVLGTPAMIKTPSGLIYVITRRSSGRLPLAGETVVVNYTGLLPSGVKFDSSLDRGQPFKFKLGAGRVIKGWDEGVRGMKIGEKRQLIIPAALGYGDRGAGDVIPPGATLIFEVQLLGVQG